MNLKTFLKIIFIVLLLPALLTSCVFISLPRTTPLVEQKIGGEGKEKILIIDISGIIRGKVRKRAFAPTEPLLSARIREELDKAKEDEMVKGIILRINTPGGEVTTTDIIHHEIERYKEETGVFVHAVLMDIAASGGYYIASAADSISAHPTTVTGSIGVVAFRINATGLIEKIGLTNETVKSGVMKDMGSPFRNTTEKERAVMQELIDELFLRFRTVVKEGRGFSDEETALVTDGRVFTATQARELGLIDSIGYMDDAVKVVKERSGIKDDATLIVYSRQGEYRSNIYSAASGYGAGRAGGAGTQINLLNIDVGELFTDGLGFKFMYIWMP